MRCPSCSNELAEDSRSCPSCGSIMPDSIVATMAGTSGKAAKLESKPASSPSGSLSSSPRRALSTSQSMGRFAPGTVLAERYRIVGLLGKGGMGEVYRAEDLTLDQSVALKFLPEKVAADPERLEQFYNEVRIARQVSHPNVCRIYDIGQVEGLLFISMEYIDGEDLASLLRRIGRLPNDKALELARQMCAGLAAAHEKGVLHRDMKPANIMIDGQGKVRLADFGLARAAKDLQDSRLIEGTPAYMAPEQFAGKGASIRSDVYSLGLVFYEMFTGKPAFRAASVSELARMHQESNPAAPSVLIAELDPIVERVILRCLEKDPIDRPSSALAVAAALPGGDPLAAALAAGETPSPEMVAAAGDEGALRPALAWAALGYILFALLTIAALCGKTTLLGWVPLPKSPDALADRSRDLIHKLGYDKAPEDSAFGFADTDFMKQLDKAMNRSEQLSAGEPPATVFWYRQSPDYLSNSSFYRVGVITQDEPSRDTPKMVSVQVDATGRLVQLRAVPERSDDAAGEHAPPDWNTLFLEAGLDITKFKAVPPSWIPPVYADTRMAWEGSYPQRSDIPMHIEAAALNGKPVVFRIFQPWNLPSRAEKPQGGADSQKVVEVILILVVIGVLAGTSLLAWRNLKLNRGDRRGALRLSLYLLLLEVISRFLQAHYVSDLGEMLGLSWLILSRGLMFAAMVWVSYIALEPHIRRLWPHAIISWSRLIAGHLRDPRVGRDVLIGAAFGISIPLLDQLSYLIAKAFGYPSIPALAGPGSVNIAMTFRNFLGSLSAEATNAVSGAMYIFLLFFILKLILRKGWLAGVVFIAALTLSNVKSNSYSFSYFILLVSLALNVCLIFLLQRFGLVAVMAAIFFLNVVEAFPITMDSSRWFWYISSGTMLFLAGLAAYAFRVALAGKPAFAIDLFKE
jgi:hypothetical protein